MCAYLISLTTELHCYPKTVKYTPQSHTDITEYFFGTSSYVHSPSSAIKNPTRETISKTPFPPILLIFAKSNAGQRFYYISKTVWNSENTTCVYKYLSWLWTDVLKLYATVTKTPKLFCPYSHCLSWCKRHTDEIFLIWYFQRKINVR